MIEAVVQHINEVATFSFWKDKLGGIATAIKTHPMHKDKTVPFGHCMGCNDGGEVLLPDDSLRSVAFWEIDSPEERGVMRDMYEAEVSLLAWLNLHKFGSVEEGCTDRTITARIQKEIINEVQSVKGASSNGAVRVSKVEFLGARRKDLSIFSKYTFKDDVNWFFGKYDYFGLRFRVTFSVSCDAVIYRPEEC